MKKSRRRGRPREFDIETALGNACKVFLEKGYEGASLDDLTGAMKITRPSLYVAFGNKEGLYEAVLEYYTEPGRQELRRILFSASDLRQAFHDFFQAIIHRLNENRNCREHMDGCLVVNSTILSCREKTGLSEKIQTIHKMNEELFYERLKHGQEQGELGSDQDIRVLAQYFNAILQGMAVLARVQQSELVLRNIAQAALQVFP